MASQKMTESEEMYLLTIARLAEAGHEGPVPLSTLAEELSVMPVSANQMVRKLDEEGIVEYQPYKGVRLLEEGLRRAQSVLRHRRLWEVFFVEQLGLPLSEADALACRMEHLTPPEVAERLYDFLGQPAFSAQGKPIPPIQGNQIKVRARPLSELQAGQSAEVLRVDAAGPARSFLEGEGLLPGARVFIEAVGGGGAVLVEIGGRKAHLSAELAAAVQASPITQE